METKEYIHVEAFCLMYYEHAETRAGFVIWNSRDGVTPFIVFEDGKEYQHAHWYMDMRITDQRIIDNRIKVTGQRYFRDTTADEAVELATRRVKALKGSDFEVMEGSDEWLRLREALTEDFINQPHMDKF